MKIFLIYLVLGLVLISLTIYQTTSLYQPTETEIQLSDTLIDLGTVNKGDSAIAIFTVKNIGKNKLIIFKVNPDCHCTLVRAPKKEIDPGEIAEIIIKYDSSLLGYFTSSVTLDLNTETKNYLLIVRGLIKNKDESHTVSTKEVEIPL